MKIIRNALLVVVSGALLAACGTTTNLEEGNLSAQAVDTWWLQDFTDDTAGWTDGGGIYGDITHNPGDGTATVEGSTTDETGPYSFFDQRRDEWPGEYIAEIDVYLDPAWTAGEGFDYSVAAWGTDNAHQRDYIFHVGQVNGEGLLVNGSNNSDWTFNANKLVNQDAEPYEVTTEGWYTLQHVFREDSGHLYVDLRLLDSAGDELWATTRGPRTAGDDVDTIGEDGQVGGNGYGWFVYISVGAGADIDNHELYQVVPGPGTKDDCKNGGWQAFDYKNQGQCIASIQANENAGE